MNKNYFVYILTNKNNTVLYIGVTSDLSKRLYLHKIKLLPGFTNKYNLTKLLYFEIFDNPEHAINREKQLKNWHKDWKWNLIKEHNPKLNDISDTLK